MKYLFLRAANMKRLCVFRLVVSKRSPKKTNITAHFWRITQKKRGDGCNRSTVLLGATVEIGQEKGPSVALDTADSTVEGIDEYIVRTNALYSGRWVSNQHPERYAIAIKASDPGIGVKAYGLKIAE